MHEHATVALLPSGFMTMMSESPGPSVNAILLPSGDHTGLRALDRISVCRLPSDSVV